MLEREALPLMKFGIQQHGQQPIRRRLALRDGDAFLGFGRRRADFIGRTDGILVACSAIKSFSGPESIARRKRCVAASYA